jgi:hypothetical protein
LISANLPRHQSERLVPGRFAELVALRESAAWSAGPAVHIIPAKLALDAGGNAVGRALRRLHFQNVPVLGPDIEAATDAAVGADRLGALDVRLAHGRFHFRELQNRP